MREAVPGADFRVLGDQPYVLDGDPFGFGDLARGLRTLIVDSRGSTPFTIGIEASWGRGKSSLMAQLEKALKDEEWRKQVDGLDGIRTVSFNAWTAEGQDVLEGLVKTVLQGMDPNVLRRALRNRKVIGGLKIALLLVAGWLRVGALVNEAWDRLSVDARTRNQVNDLVREAMNDWIGKQRGETEGVPPRKLLVVFVDDLDRCSPRNVVKVFEGLKLYLDAPGFVFVVGYDEIVLAQSVADRKQFPDAARGRDYVEKIVQIVFRIPQPSDDEVGILLRSNLESSGTSKLFDEAGKALVVDRNGRNPRRIKRFINRFILDYQLDAASKDLEAELLIKLLIFETYFPEFAGMLSEGDENRNPIAEFERFVAARAALRNGQDQDPVVKELFADYRVSVGDTAEASLALLKQEADVRFLALVEDDNFVSLVSSISTPADQEQILAKVRRRRQLGTSAPSSEDGSSASGGSTASQAAFDISGRRIVWIDSRPENVAAVAERLRSYGAAVEVVPDSESETQRRVLADRPDLLISDVGSSGGPRDVGFERLATLRKESGYEGPVVFNTTRLSTARRAQADGLGADIVSGEDELLRVLARLFPAAESMAVA